MSLSNAQYESIKSIFIKRQADAKDALSKRLEEIYARSPEYKELSDLLNDARFEKAMAELSDDTEKIESIDKKIEDYKEQKEVLFSTLGFPENYDKMIYTCNRCNDTGFVNGGKCSCFRQMQAELLFDSSNIKEQLAKENFDTFSFEYFDKKLVDSSSGLTAYEIMQKNYQIAKDMADNFVPGRKNLLFMGPAGTGKTFLSNCIAKEVIEKGFSVVYLSAMSLFEKLAESSFGKDSDSREQIIGCDLLIIDDLGTEYNNTFVSSQFFYCLNERKLRGRSTIISTNYDMNEIRDAYSERVSSRLLEGYQTCKFFNKDIRILKKAKEKSNV